MKRKLCIVAILSVGLLPAQAADWEGITKTAPQIEAVNMKATPLVASADKKGWAKVPPELSKHGAIIYMPAASTNGVADLKVTADGYLMLACNYDYQGNSSGNWDTEVWNERKFKTKGWHTLSKNELGGVLVNGENREQIIFIKQVHKGEALRIRCNKYDPPFPILLPAKP